MWPQALKLAHGACVVRPVSYVVSALIVFLVSATLLFLSDKNNINKTCYWCYILCRWCTPLRAEAEWRDRVTS